MNSNKYKVAILLATYNGAKFINEQIISILGQTHDNFHLFVRDDQSSDGTLAILRRIADNNNKISIIDSSNDKSTGSAAANFFTLMCSIDSDEFSHFCFSDQDDIWAPEKITRALECLKVNSANGYSSNMVAFNYFNNRAWYAKKDQPQTEFDYIFQGASAGCTYVFDKEIFINVFNKIKPLLATLPTLISHDWIVYAIARSYNFKWHMDSNAPIFYRQHQNNVYGAKQGFSLLISKINLLKSGWYRNHILWNRSILQGTSLENEIFSRISSDTLTDRLWLALNSKKFRRSKIDRFYLIIIILSGVFYKEKFY